MKNLPSILTLSALIALSGPIYAAENQAGNEPVDVLPAVGLSEELMFRYLSAEIALQRGNAFAAYATMLSIARSTHDPRLARRATEMAISGSLPAEALKAARVWHEVAPHSEEAAQVLLSLQLQSNQIEEAKQSLAKMLSGSTPTTLPVAIGNVQRMLSRIPDRSRAAALLKESLEPYRHVLDARLALAQMAMVGGDRAGAKKEIGEALAKFPASEIAVLMLAQIIEDKAEATKTLSDFLKKNPKAREVRLAYSRMLFEQGKIADAKKEFQVLLQQAPNDQTALYALGLLSAQANDMADAEKYLAAYVGNLKDQPDRERDATQALMVLAQIAEDRNDDAGVMKWLEMVPILGQSGSVNATIKRAQLQSKAGKLEEARKLLNEADVNNDDERVRLIIGEAQLLRDAGKLTEALRLIEDALELYKDNIDLLYELSMLAEKNHQFDLMESTLRKVIQLAPDSQHAYNALGYSLADRNLRLQEAHDLIQKALSLAPEDPFIMDSMGWVEFRLGRLEKAEELLRRAFAIKADPEIAAHLGEVLWVLGREEEARKLWRNAGGKDPKNDTLKSTLKRLQVKL